MITSDSPLADHAVREAVMRGRFKLLLMTAVGQKQTIKLVGDSVHCSAAWRRAGAEHSPGMNGIPGRAGVGCLLIARSYDKLGMV